MKERAAASKQVSFPVSKVAPAAEPLPVISVRSAIERTARSNLVVCPRAEQKVVSSGDFHSLIAAAALAYKQHYPLVLSPDMIWLAVLQGVAQHVANNAEALRARVVPHQTKIELVVESELSSLPQNDTEMLAATRAFLDKIEAHLKPEKRFLLRTEFSTTTDVERIAGAIVVMDAFQPYFDYVFAIICGIPSVVLEGTTADWELLGARVRALHDSDLDLSWWTRHLLPLCEQFVRASRGEVDRNHWQSLCKLVERYGVDDLNGWLLKFIPYVRRDKNEVPRERNPVLELTEFPADKDLMGQITGCTSNMLPTGLSFAPVTCMNVSSGTKTPYQFIAGFTGVTQSPDDLSLRPAISWAIAEGARIDRLLERLRSEHEVHPPRRVDTETLLRTFERNLPGDLWRFYTETDGAALNIKNPAGVHCTINSASQLRLAIDLQSVHRELQYLLLQGRLTRKDFDERSNLARAYSHFRVFAESYEEKRHFYYVFGDDPERFADLTSIKESRGQIFRWSGEPTREAFQPVAHTFSDWLEGMLARTTVDGSKGQSSTVGG